MNRRKRLQAASIGGGLMLFGLCSPVIAQEAATGLRAQLVMTDATGKLVDRTHVGALTTLSVRFEDAATGKPRTGLYPSAWLRRDPSRAACMEVAKQLRATGRLTSDDIALTGTTFVSMGEDNRLALIHPDVSLATSNIAALLPLAETPSDILSHRSGPVYAALQQAGEVLAIDPQSGASKVFARGLIAPRQLLDGPDGRLWVIDRVGAHLFDRSGQVIRSERVDMPSATPAGRDALLLLVRGKETLVLDRGTGGIRHRLAGLSHDQGLSGHDTFVVQANGTHADLTYFDDPSRPRRLPSSGPVSHVKVSDDGAFALLWSNITKRIDVLDIITARRLHTFAASDTIDQVRIAGEAAFITYVQRSVVSVVNLRVLGDGDNAVREVRLAEADTSLTKTRTGSLMTSLAPASAVLVARPGGKSLFTVMAGGGLANAPMSVLSLKSASPQALLAHRRMLEADAEGRYAGTLRIPTGGTWELVVTTGVQGTTACFPVLVDGPTTPQKLQPSKLVVTPAAALRAQQPASLKLSISQPDAAGRLNAVPIPVRITSLSGGWMKALAATPANDGSYELTVTFPWAGTYVLSAGQGRILPTTIEISP